MQREGSLSNRSAMILACGTGDFAPRVDEDEPSRRDDFRINSREYFRNPQQQGFLCTGGHGERRVLHPLRQLLLHLHWRPRRRDEVAGEVGAGEAAAALAPHLPVLLEKLPLLQPVLPDLVASLSVLLPHLGPLLERVDVLAPKLNDIDDVERHMPGTISVMREWLRNYKTADGKPQNTFGMDEKAMNREYTMEVVQETNEFWKKLTEKGQKTV